MKQKDKERRLRLLCGENRIHAHDFELEKPFSIDNEIEAINRIIETVDKKQSSRRYSKMLYDTLELCILFKDLGYNDQEALVYWRGCWWERGKQKRQYDMKPIPVKKDNPNLYGAEFVGGGTVRQPKKCRKTAWKRFNKLFPDKNDMPSKK